MRNDLDLRTLCAWWAASFKANPNHAIKDANTNLPGFPVLMSLALRQYPLDYAFHVAIKRALLHLGVKAQGMRAHASN